MGKDLNRRKKMVKRAAGICAVLTGACLAILLGGCGKKVKEPVTVTLCHVYGGLRSGRQYKTGNINKNYVQMIQVKSELYLVYSR